METTVKGNLTKEEAIKFFSAFYGGEHHLPSTVKNYGYGWCLHDHKEMSTYDFDELTRLVVMAHDCCIRVSIMPLSPQLLRIAIWKRKRDGDITAKHPTMEDAIKRIRSNTSKSTVWSFEAMIVV